MEQNPKHVYHVKSRFTVEQLDGKRLRWYTQEYPLNYRLRVSNFDPTDKSFVPCLSGCHTLAVSRVGDDVLALS